MANVGLSQPANVGIGPNKKVMVAHVSL